MKTRTGAWILVCATTILASWLVWHCVNTGLFNWRLMLQIAVVEVWAVAMVWDDLKGRRM